MYMETLEEYIKKHRENKEKASSFYSYLLELMDKYGFDKESDLYNKANISKEVWSNIKLGKSHPSLKVCYKLVFALGVDNHECKYLLKKAGYTLSSSNEYALIIRYGIENKLNIDEVNDLLDKNGYSDQLIY